VQALFADKFVPGLLDRYLARNGYEAQQATEPVESDRPDNLYAPVEGEYAAHGRFDAQAKENSFQLWAPHTGTGWPPPGQPPPASGCGAVSAVNGRISSMDAECA
jgi:hypothetical protein